MGRVGERLRQNLFFTSGFDATSNQRNTSTLKELEAHEKALRRTIKHVRDFHKATLALLGESETSYQMQLPRAYELDTTKSVLPTDSEDVLYTKNSVPAVPQERPDPALSTRQTGIARITDVKGQLVCVIRVGHVWFYNGFMHRRTASATRSTVPQTSGLQTSPLPR